LKKKLIIDSYILTKQESRSLKWLKSSVYCKWVYRKANNLLGLISN